MKKPPYELKALLLSIEQCEKNIEAFRDAIKKEYIREEDMLRYVKQWEIYNEINRE